MSQVIRVKQPGGVDQLELAEVAVAAPGDGEVRLRQVAMGINFVDVYQRSGLYPLPGFPAAIGFEAAGVVEAVGSGVTELRPGDRVAYAGAPVGAYATERVIPAWRAVKVPGGLADAVAGTALARGITAYMLETKVFAVGPENTALVHSAAGGLGNLLVRWAKRRGARVIATVGSEAKAALAREAGADHVIVGRDADFAAEVAALTGGAGVDVAYDGVGGATLMKTLACVRPFGTVASFGQSAGPIPPIAVEEIGPRRSLSLARPSVMHYMSDPALYRRAAAEVLAAAAEGLTSALGRSYRLSQASEAHADLERGATTGSPYLIP